MSISKSNIVRFSVLKTVVCFSSLLSLISCNDHERNCTDFRTGKFEFTQNINGKKNTSTFIRTEKLQIETYNGKTDTASVRWVNDCEFILQKLHPKSMKEEKAISIKILFTEKNSYTFEYSFVGSNQKQRGTVTKID
ncbi:DNA topoisomerase IV [Flavobacterium sp.]|jgi:hypothetical protein|uniref:DNA topoisomerase IV n=1 Tax=Flavobacterium sp. TaxID=239 RepID=UPI0037C15449